jgi:hypothetical protein
MIVFENNTPKKEGCKQLFYGFRRVAVSRGEIPADIPGFFFDIPGRIRGGFWFDHADRGRYTPSLK